MICFGKSKVVENVLSALKNNFVEIFSASRLEIYHDGRVGAELICNWDLFYQRVLICQVLMELRTQFA